MGKPGTSCEMCGKQDFLMRALVEGVEMSVCKGCASFGRILQAPRMPMKSQGSLYSRPKEPQVVEESVEEYAMKIKQAREKRNLNQEEFAKMVNEHASLLKNIEAGKQRPTFDLAKKLEKMLNIVLIEKSTTEDEPKEEKRSPKGPLTIGDILSMKK